MRLNSRGVIHFALILLAAVGIIAYFLVTSSFPFKDRLFSLLYPKPSSKAQEGLPKAVPGEILLKFKGGVDDKNKNKIRKQYGLEKKDEIPQIGVERVKVSENTRDQTIKVLKKDLNVEYAEPNFVAKAQAVTNDPSLQSQWGMFEINAANYSGQSAWDITTGDPSVRIAIVDSGIMENHEDISGKVVASRNFTPSSTVDDLCGHGTHVAGTAAAQTNNGKGGAGVGYRSSLMNVKVLDKDPEGDCWGEYSWIANGIVWAVDNGAKVINLSLAGFEPSTTLENAVNYAWNKGVVLVAAAGNYGTDQPFYPAFFDNVIAVAATNVNHVKSSFSNYGSWVDVAAPGNVIYSTYANDPSLTYAYMTGTSMAAPHVAGIAALVWAAGTCSTNTCVRSAIERNADNISGTGTDFTYGLVNAYKSVGGIGSVPPPPAPTPVPKNPPCDSLGDVDQDGLVSISDADLALQLWAGMTQLTSEQKRRADVNVDSNIDPLDAQDMLRYLNNEIMTFPGCSAPTPPTIVPTPTSSCQDPCGLDTITCSGGNILTSCQQGGGLCSRYTIGTPCGNISPGALGEVTSCTSIPACTTPTPTPAPTPTPTPTPIPIASATPSYKRVFVTSTTYTANLGGVIGADAKCQTRANTNNLGGIWKAWLSDDSYAYPINKLTHSTVPYKLLDGTTIANNWADLTDGSLKSGIALDEFGKSQQGAEVFTSTAYDGSQQVVGATCSSWGYAGWDVSMIFGQAGMNTYQWTEGSSTACGVSYHLYCFEQ